MRATPRYRAALAALLIGSLLGAGWGCASAPRLTAFRYFERPSFDDPWTPKIAAWQSRERAIPDVEDLRVPEVSVSAEQTPSQVVPIPGDLRAKYFSFRAERKRAMAREVAEWIQSQAKRHYVADGAIDHWATLEETLDGNGDDCDGLELLVFHFLRDLGFPEGEVYRAIVVRPSDGQHHMVTLWFEQETDPWVIDPTGAMTTGMPRMSDVPEWRPIKVFSDSEEFSARLLSTAGTRVNR